eukprot:15447030-Alexandrium_andersonii.AAC.1
MIGGAAKARRMWIYRCARADQTPINHKQVPATRREARAAFRALRSDQKTWHTKMKRSGQPTGSKCADCAATAASAYQLT